MGNEHDCNQTVYPCWVVTLEIWIWICPKRVPLHPIPIALSSLHKLKSQESVRTTTINP